MNFWNSRTTTIVLVALIAGLSIHFFYRLFDEARADLTQDDLYSLSEGSEQILDRMQEEGVKPVEITLYFSETAGKTLPKFVKDFITYSRYLRSLLKEYERGSGGKIEVAFVDPVPDSDEAQAAADAGLDGKLINQEGDLFYFGLTFVTQTGSREVIDFLWPNEQGNVEYEITKTLSRLMWPNRQRVGVLSSLEVMGSASDPYMAQMLAAQGRQPTPKWIAVQLMEELYETTSIPADTEEISSEEIDLLVVIHPKQLPAKTLFAIDQWVAQGGDTIVFVDAYALDDRAPQNPQQPWMQLQYQPASDLEPLLSHWGVERPDSEFAADFELAARRPVGGPGGAESLIVDLVMDAEVDDQTVAEDQPFFQGLADFRFLLSGALREVGSETEAAGEAESEAATETDVEILPLFTTTATGNTLRIEPGFGGQGGTLAFTDFNNPARLRDAFRPGEEPVVLAYLIRGPLGSAYPDGVDYPSVEPERPPGLPPGIELPPPEGAEMVHKDPVPAEQYADAAVMVFADVDFISDQIAFSQNPFGMVSAANDNHRVLLNAIDYLLGAEELMSVRSKRPLRRPFERFDEIEAAAERETLDREREIRADIESVEQELRDKQGGLTVRDAALFQKRVQDEVDELNERIAAGRRELREIRQDRRAAIEREEAKVRFAVVGWMPILVLALGLWRAWQRRSAVETVAAPVKPREAAVGE